MATKILDEHDGNFQEIESELDSKAELSDLIGIKEEEGSSVEIGGNTYTVGSNAIKTGNTDINIAVGNNSIASGDNTVAFGNTSYAGGYQTAAIGDNSYVTGYSFAYPFDYINPDSTDEEIIEAWGTHKFSLAKGDYSFVSGSCNLALGTEDSADGANNIACGGYSHASGTYTKASGAGSSTEGFRTKANGNFSRAIGNFTEANGNQSFTGGIGTVANGNSTTAIGRFNVSDTVDSDGEGDYAFIVGNGVDSDHKSNAFAVKWDGTIESGTIGNLTNLDTTDKSSLVAAINELYQMILNL